MPNSLERNMTNEDGATAIEYALIAGMIALVIIVAVGIVGNEVTAIFTQLESLL